jgi:CRISPR-associated DxTHG motif protein
MRRIITFLGIQAKKTTYSFEGKNYDGEVFAEALHKFCDYESMLVCVTKDAKIKTFPVLEKLTDKRIEAVDIPNGETTKEMWETFEKITKKVDSNDTVIFDITHGLRSLPFLVFLFAAYLKAAKNVTIEAIYYGAWELGFSNNGIAPVIDLSEFVSMIDWITATDQFTKTGNGEELAKLLREKDETTVNLANSITGIAQGLQMLRPMDVLRESAILPKSIEEAAPTLSKTVPPFVTLLGRVKQDYGMFALENPEDYTSNAKAALLRQIDMIDWYVAKGQIVQALSMAREWLPSLLCYHFKLDPQIEKPNRSEMELLLNGGKTPPDKDGNKYESPHLEEYKSTIPKDKRKKLTDLWKDKYKLANLRNDVLHSGFRKHPQSAVDILQKTEEIITELKDIAKQWKLYD